MLCIPRSLTYTHTYTQKKENQIRDVQAEIERLKIQLQQEKMARKNKEEYETLLAVINNYPSRKATDE
jgi:hypothetical protein